MGKSKAVSVESDVNQHILNIITPAGIDFDNTHVNLGENIGKFYAVSKYPTEGVDYGWLSDLCNLEGTSTVIEYRYTDASRITVVFNKKIKELKANQELLKQESEKQQNEKAIKDLEEMIRRIAVMNEPVGYVNILLLVQDTMESALNARLKRINSIVAITGCNMRNLKYKQFQALTCAAPYGRPSKEVSNIGDRNMPISTFVGGFPMANAGIVDDGGYYLGKTKGNRLIILNTWLRNKDRVNTNWFITGLPGVGKSSFIKSVFIRELAFGSKIIVFDAEKEYHDLAKHPDINGEIIDCTGGSTGRINPLQIRSSPKITSKDLSVGENPEDFYEYDEEMGSSDMALHIQNLRTFFKLYFGIEAFTSSIKTALEESLVKTYQEKGIDWDTDVSTLQPEDFPILSDLYKTVLSFTNPDYNSDLEPEPEAEPDTKARKKARPKKITEYKKNVYAQLADLLYSVSVGADRGMWNGPTTLNPRTQFIVLDTSMLQDVDSNVKNAQYMNISMWSWQEMSRDRTEKVILAADEGYLFVDPDYPELMKFFRNISKRDRKYEGGLMFITHSVVDVLDPAVKRMGQALIDNACYKFIMGCDGKNLEETAKLFNLTEKEINILASKNRGQGILYAGSVRIDAKIDIRDGFLEMMGKAGGR